MKKLLALPLLLILPVSQFAQQRKTIVLALTHVTVIDMTGARPKPDMTVVVTGNRITAIGKTGRARVPQGARVIDASGKFLIPGLWDMHVHFTETERTFPMFIANGITGVRNMGGAAADLFRWRAEVASGRLVGPRIVACGPIVDGPDPAAHGPTVVVANAAPTSSRFMTGSRATRILPSLPKRSGSDCPWLATFRSQ